MIAKCECETKRVWVCHIVSIFNGSSNGKKKKNYIYDKLCLADAACAVFTQQMVEFNATTPFVPASLSWCEPDISYPLLPFSLPSVIIVFSSKVVYTRTTTRKKKQILTKKRLRYRVDSEFYSQNVSPFWCIFCVFRRFFFLFLSREKI